MLFRSPSDNHVIQVFKTVIFRCVRTPEITVFNFLRQVITLNTDKKIWITNIENVASIVATNVGIDTVNAVFGKYDAHNLDDLSPCYYCNVFDELDFIANDN